MYELGPRNAPVIHQRVAIDTRGPFTRRVISKGFIYEKYELQCAPQHVNKMKYVNMHFGLKT